MGTDRIHNARITETLKVLAVVLVFCGVVVFRDLLIRGIRGFEG